jgi:hypothetical protein
VGRDLHVSITGDEHGFDRAMRDAEESAKGLDRELGKLERQQKLAEHATERTSDAVRRYGREQDKAALAARKAGDTARDAARRADMAIRRAAEAADKLAHSEISQAEATKRAEAAERAIERAALAAAAAHRAAAKAAEDQADEERQLSRASSQATKGLTAQRSTLVSLIGAGALAASGATAAAVAFGAFGVIAAGSIVKVVSAQQDLTGSWDTLTGRQKVAALSVRSLVNDYKALSRSYEPEALAAFNNLIGTARGLLPRLGSVLDATSGDVAVFTSRIAGFVDQRIGGEFLSWTGRQAPRALDTLGDTMTVAGDTALDLVQDIAPLGLEVLEMTNGVLKAVNALANVNPLLAQFAVSAIALRAPVTGVVNTLGGMAGRMRTAGAAAEGASRSGRLLNMVTAAGPSIYVAAGVALAFLAVKSLTAKDNTDRLIDSMRVSYQAVGNNLLGHQQMAAALARRIQAEKALQAVAVQSNTAQAEGAGLTGRTATAVEKLTAAQQAEVRAYNNVIAGATQLGNRYGITTNQATRLADAAGVDLSTSLDKSGRLTAGTQAKIDQYRAAVEQAANPTKTLALAWEDAGNSALQMKDRVNALNSAMELQLNPSLAVYKLQNQLKQGYGQVIDALVAAKGRMDGVGDASGQLVQAFSQQIETVRDLGIATLRKTGSDQQAAAAVRAQLPVLYALAGRNGAAREQVDKLATAFQIATGRTTISRQAFMAAAAQMNINKAAAARLWHEYQKIPRSVNTNIRANAGQAWQAIAVTKSRLASIPSVVRTTIVATAAGPVRIGSGHYAKGGLVGYASGGMVHSVPAFPSGGRIGGAGTGTSDSNLIAASRGEFVVNARDTAQNLGLLQNINAGMFRIHKNVTPAPRMAHPAAGGGVMQLNLNLDGRTVAKVLIDPMRREIKNVAGGDVQKALGFSR